MICRGIHPCLRSPFLHLTDTVAVVFLAIKADADTICHSMFPSQQIVH